MSIGSSPIGAPSRNGAKPPRNIEAQLDPGPPVPGYNCHVVIDGVGYIFADLASYTQESGKAVTNETLAPYFGDPQNALDTLSSDMTMLLPIGQGDFSEGMGFTDLERNPKGFNYSENLMVTPQNTLINGPKVSLELFTSGANPGDFRPYPEGYFGGTITSDSVGRTYFGIGQNLYKYNTNGTWSPLAARAGITEIQGYSGRIVIGYDTAGGDIFYNDTPSVAQFLVSKMAVLNGNPFVLARDGRVYSAFLNAPGPDSIEITDEAGTDTSLSNWAYALQYGIKLPDNSLYWTGLGLIHFATRIPNKELVLELGAVGYKGGPVLRRLYRSENNKLDEFYLLADETILGPNQVRYVDTTTDAVLITKPKYDWLTQNTTGMVILIGGEFKRNMQFPDTEPIWLAENLVPPYTGDFVNTTEVFRDSQGNEALIIGTTSGLFMWDGSSTDFQVLRDSPYHIRNYKYMAVNHGFVYFTLMDTSVYVWNTVQQSEIQGPWVTHFSYLQEIRLTNAGRYVAFAAIGVLKNESVQTCIIYLYDGQRFAWAYRWNGGTDWRPTSPIMGRPVNSNDLLFYKGATTGINRVSTAISYSQYETSNVVFRSSVSDGDLPRLRKQVHAVMVRYLQMTPQPSTTLDSDVPVGATSFTVAFPVPFAVGDWIRIGHHTIEFMEYRKITNITSNIITVTHALGAPLVFPHLNGAKVVRCGAVATLRNIFVSPDEMDNPQDIEVGGPCESKEIFAYCRLPIPVYTYADSVEIRWRDGVIMELTGWSMLTGLNPQWNGLSDMTIRLQDYTKLPNNMYDNATAAVRQSQLKEAYNKGTVTVIDPLGNKRIMRFQRLTFTYEEPKERHPDGRAMQATASARLIDQLAELNKAQDLTLTQLSGQIAQQTPHVP